MTDKPPLSEDYEAAPLEHRWKGRLDMLFMTLEQEARASSPSPEDLENDRGWFWRILPRGAVVGMRKRPDMQNRFELRISRRGDLDPKNKGRWEAELGIFMDKFQARVLDGETRALVPGGAWLRLPLGRRDEGKTVARYIMLWQGETKPGKTCCHDCSKLDPPVYNELEHNPAYGVNRCQQHALEAGRKAS